MVKHNIHSQESQAIIPGRIEVVVAVMSRHIVRSLFVKIWILYHIMLNLKVPEQLNLGEVEGQCIFVVITPMTRGETKDMVHDKGVGKVNLES